jgi:hypothetical protein
MSRNPIASLGIAPYAPQVVLDACDKFQRAADAWAKKVGEIQDAEEATEAEVQKERARVEAAALAGEPLKIRIAEVRERGAAKVADLREEERALAKAVDIKGNELAEVIEANAEAWAQAFPPRKADAVEQLRDALEVVKRCILEISQADGAVAWLAGFSYKAAVGGDVRSCTGAPIKVDIGTLSRNDNPMAAHKVVAVLEQLAK